MDVNDLDSLLDELSSMDGELNDRIDADSDMAIDTEDMEDITLEELDSLESMDIGDLDLDDIDFDDVDITKLDAGAITSSREEEPDDSGLNLDALIEAAGRNQLPAEEDGEDEVFREADHRMQEEETDFSDVFDDAFFERATGEAAEKESRDDRYTAGEEELDQLFARTMEQSLEDGDLSEIDKRPEPKSKRNRKAAAHPKRSVSEIVFGKPDEDDLEEEALLKEKKAAKAAEREKKKEERAAKHEQKQAAKQEMLAVKQKKDKEKQQLKADRKRQADAEYQAELENSRDSRVKTPTVIVVFVLFFALAAAVVIGTNQFSYTQVIKKAADYFERQRYRLAYDQVSGVEVKEKDQELKDRIYTVMYVERLYESYENNLALGRNGQALDALIRGLEKYDEHYEEAVELDIVEDIDSSREKILNALWNTYGITEETAYQLMSLSGQEYSAAISEYDQ